MPPGIDAPGRQGRAIHHHGENMRSSKLEEGTEPPDDMYEGALRELR